MYKVTNGNSFTFTAKYNGTEYKFPEGIAVYCDDDATNHIFGLGAPNKASVLARHGWATVSNTYQDGLKVLNAFAFEHMSPVYDAPLAIVEDHGPAPVDQDASDEGGTDGSPESGAVAVPPKRGRPPATAAA